MKKALILAAALVLILAMAVPAMAATTQGGVTKIQEKDLVPVTDITKTSIDPGKVWGNKDLVNIGGRFYLPLEDVMQLFGGNIYWDGKNWVVIQQQKQWDNLKYFFGYDYASKELVLTVYNPNPYPVKLTFNTSKTHDIIVTREGQKVWQLSDDQNYSQLWHQETLDAWGVKNYRTKLPPMPSGSYKAYVFFAGGYNKDVVAATEFYNIGPATDFSKLSYSLRYQSANWGSTPKMVFTISNTSDKPVTQYFWSDQTFDLVIKNNKGTVWKFSDGKDYQNGFNTKTIAAGGLSSKFIYLPDLKPGYYTALAYDYSVSEDWPVTTTAFYVW